MLTAGSWLATLLHSCFWQGSLQRNGHTKSLRVASRERGKAPPRLGTQIKAGPADRAGDPLGAYGPAGTAQIRGSLMSAFPFPWTKANEHRRSSPERAEKEGR